MFRLSIMYVIIGIWQYITTASFLLEKEKKAKQANKQTKNPRSSKSKGCVIQDYCRILQPLFIVIFKTILNGGNGGRDRLQEVITELFTADGSKERRVHHNMPTGTANARVYIYRL